MILSLYTYLFEREGRFYLFNSESLFFSEISEEMFRMLEGGNFGQLPQEVLDVMKEKRTIVAEEEKYTFYHDALTRFYQNAYGSDRMSLVIAPTTDCNFACPYCFEPKKNPKSMTEEVEDKVVAYLNKQTHIKGIHLTWYGGEPLLCQATISRLTEKIKKETDKEILSTSITTNGSLITDSTIALFKEIGLDDIQISLDGIRATHDKTRCFKKTGEGSFDLIIRNVKRLAREMPDLHISLRVNINRKNADDFAEVYLGFEKEGLKNVAAYPGLIREDAPDGRSLCSDSYSNADLVDLYAYLRQKGVDTHFFPTYRGKGCMMQRETAFIIGPEGELYKCWNDVSRPETVVGSIMDTKPRNYHLLMNYMHECGPFDSECRDCKVFPLCDGGCGKNRWRNRFEGGEFRYCSPYKETENLEAALFAGKNQGGGNAVRL